ncbi:methylthioribose-1-phosphate isomerase [Alicyclobacillus hesperidum]|uniref:Methylthioribose-1-phosphate isomerase n=1 Tax=Alicyclobacillus hesperidum TaxID=89784 RepID=A0A1H2WRV6_9BACL|nr:S-methyl-5-thioribose-1-phosphate isomerase [Alicyclobacillus hesperidum]SDW83403.1 methylthioribose-1-phosphate isomerase [Alicyclobacillus hesperidum]
MRAIRWAQGQVELLDQTKLPHESVWETFTSADEVAAAIRDMKVRGAPAIGAAAAFGLAAEACRLQGDPQLREKLHAAATRLRSARPTAVNLAQALDAMLAVLEQTADDAIADALYAKAVAIADADVATNRRIGAFGADVIAQHGGRILTHCNTGSLATVEYGTALGVIRALHERGILDHVYVDETRPYLQGARLTAYELAEEGIPFDIITDSTAGYAMAQGWVDAVVVGADRIARNGDTANKIGTYTLAVLAQYHGIPFYVAAPTTTLDLATSTGRDIPIEERHANEVTHIFGRPIAPNGASARHLAFDVTPGELITGIITEWGVAKPPYIESLTEIAKRDCR